MDDKVPEVLPFPTEKTYEIAAWMQELPRDARLLVIIVASRADDMIKDLLQKVMLHQGGATDLLFDNDRPLGTFSSRIALAYRLGLIDRDVESFLQKLRKLRNDAAHSAQQMDLGSAPHIDRISHLQNLASKSETWGTFSTKPIVPHEAPGFSLFMSCMYLIFNLSVVLLNTKPFANENVCTFNRMRMQPIDEIKKQFAGRTAEDGLMDAVK